MKRTQRTQLEFWVAVWLGVALGALLAGVIFLQVNEQTGGALAKYVWNIQTIHDKPRVILGIAKKALPQSKPYRAKLVHRVPNDQADLATLAAEIVLPPFGYSRVLLHPEPIEIDGRTWWRVEFDLERRVYPTSKPIIRRADVCFSLDPDSPDNPELDLVCESAEIASKLGRSL